MGCKPRFTKEQAEEIRKLYREHGLTMAEIARAKSSSFNAVANAIKFIENGFYDKAEAKSEKTIADLKRAAAEKARETAMERMRKSREKHKQQLDVIFDFCMHDIPEKGCANCPLCPAKLGFDVCGDQPPKSERLKKAIEIINEFREVQSNENYA